jgi:ABC-2 type transport system permease protein
MIVNTILHVFDLFKWAFKLFKVDYQQLRLILLVKLTTDDRQKQSNNILIIFVINVITGIFLGILVVFIKSLLVSMVLVHATIMLMVALSLISNFSRVLLDTTDNRVLNPRPIDSRTFFMARIAYISVYLFLITLGLSLVSMVAGTIKFGLLFLPAFIFTLFLNTLFIIFITNLFYIVLMRFSTMERLRDIILYFQIFISMMFMFAYIMVPKLLNISYLKELTFSITGWVYLMPPAWMGGTLDAIVNGNFQSTQVICIALAAVIPILSMFIVVKFLAPHFNRRLAQMEVSSATSRETRTRTFFQTLDTFFSKLLSRNRTERAVFQMIWRIAARDRKFKLIVYPNLGFILFFFYQLVLAPYESFYEVLYVLPHTQKFIILLYISCVLIPLAIYQSTFNDSFKAAWVYRVLPFAEPGDILAGALKAIIMKFILPFFIISAFILFIWGLPAVDDVLLGFLNVWFICIMVAFMSARFLPFSRKHIVNDPGIKKQRFFLTLMIIILGIIHYSLTQFKYGVTVAIPLLFLLITFLLHKYKSIPWEMIKLDLEKKEETKK